MTWTTAGPTKLSNSPWRMLKRQMRSGPVVGKWVLGYRRGIVLQKAWLRLGPVQRYYRRYLPLFQKALACMGRSDPTGELFRLHLIANTWWRWRVACMEQYATRQRWVRLHGVEQLDHAAELGRPLVFTSLHTGITGKPLTKYLRLRYVDLTSVGVYEPHDPSASLARNVNMARQAYAALARGGAVMIAADGNTGSTFAVTPLYNGYADLPLGPATLAVHNRAALIAVFPSYDLDGTIHFTFHPPLVPDSGSVEDQVQDLFQQYVQLLTQQWPTIMPLIPHHYLARFVQTPSA